MHIQYPEWEIALVQLSSTKALGIYMHPFRQYPKWKIVLVQNLDLICFTKYSLRASSVLGTVPCSWDIMVKTENMPMSIFIKCVT